jgi:FkbM family methyltransferase
VIAIEPVPETFELLAANAALNANKNVTLMNVAASDRTGLVGMEIPMENGLENLYLARLSDRAGDVQIFCLAIDSLHIPNVIRLVKVDAEGHELAVLRGMRALLQRDHPTLIVEDNSDQVVEFLKTFGYFHQKLAGSSNRVFSTREAELLSMAAYTPQTE